MGNYAKAAARAVRTLTENEQGLLLKATGGRRDGFRDHMIFSLALGTGLREHEIVALNVSDMVDVGVSSSDAAAIGTLIRQRVLLTIFKGCERATEKQEVVLPDVLRAKLGKFISWKRREGESVDPDAPLFVSRNGNRLSLRQLRRLFHVWQERAGFERRLPFHALRHTACSTLYRNTRDIRLTQRFARHASVVTTSIYAHPSDEDLLRAVRNLVC